MDREQDVLIHGAPYGTVFPLPSGWVYSDRHSHLPIDTYRTRNDAAAALVVRELTVNQATR
jgi:hypothetical protein